MARKSRTRTVGRLASVLIPVVVIVTGVVATTWIVTGASGLAGRAQQNEKFWVCKFVGTPGVDERLKAGKNPIEVGSGAVQGGVGSLFPDAQGRSYVIAISQGE